MEIENIENISLVKMLEESFRKNWNMPALSNYKDITLHYRDVARRIEKLHIIFGICGLRKGEKVAICSRNQANWGVVFLASLTYGAVPVPILHEFKPGNVHHIVNHSEGRILFVGDMIWEDLSKDEMPGLEAIIQITDFSLLYANSDKIVETREHLNELFGKKYPRNFSADNINYHREESCDDVAMINYTSGTSGFSKGVMIPFRALVSNVLFACEKYPHIGSGSNSVSMLPTAHMYGLMFEFLFEICVGAHVHFLTRVPSPKIIMDAFANIKPDIIIAVPLIIEKIYKTRLQPVLNRTGVKVLLKLPVIDKKVQERIKGELVRTFGGKFFEVIIGGAAFNREADEFFHRIGFPYTIGYGMTECAPIISYAPYNEYRIFSCGKAAPRMEIRIDSPDPEHIAGEIQVKGANVMLGYYHNPEATAAAFTEDGWMKTGDMGILDSDGFLYIKGRCKSMILGASGQNIYPEEIESMINNMPYVVESLVVEDGGKLVALIYPDVDGAMEDGIAGDALEASLKEAVEAVNADLPNYARISSLRVMPEEFEKTPKRSIKRYIYNS